MGRFLFQDRRDAGRALARALASHADDPDLLILAVPRGGVPVAAEVARGLDAPLDVFVVRKLGVPGHPELAMGAIASGGIRVLNRETLHALGVPEVAVESVVREEVRELARREELYRGRSGTPPLAARTVILVDDGMATGATMEVAVRAIRSRGPRRVVVAVPVASREAYARLHAAADEVVCLAAPDPFRAVGLWYRDFEQTTDDEVRALLKGPQGGVRAHAVGRTRTG